MHFSIIVPVYNSANFLAECLTALKESAYPDTEIIVVDDASTDNAALVAARAGVKFVQLARNSGPATARNYGARYATGEILFFVDADVVLAPNALNRIEKAFQEEPDLAAIFGSYDAYPKASGIISQYRNLLHHYVHQNGNCDASTFWAGCGAIRRFVFEELGGFDEKQFPRSSIEDIELGYRLRRSGYRIRLDKFLQGTHLKQWTLLSWIRTDILSRALPWSRLIVETKMLPNDLNLRWHQRVSFVLVTLACLFMTLGMFRIELTIIAAIALSVMLVLNRGIYFFFLRQRGLLFALACIPLHILYYLYSGFTYLYIRTGFLLRRIAVL